MFHLAPLTDAKPQPVPPPAHGAVPEPAAAGAAPHVLVDARFAARQRGGDRCRFELATRLSGLGGARYTFLTYDDTEAVLTRRAPGARAVSTTARPNRHPAGDWFEHVRLPLLRRRLHADIYHGTFNVLPLLPAAPLTVVTIHDMAVFAHPEAYGRKFAMYGRLLVRGAIARATKVIAISEATRSEILRYAPATPPGKIVVIPNGVGDEFLAAANLAPDRVDSTCRRLGIPRPYVLFVGNLEPKKNLPRLIEAFRAARAAHGLPHTLVIVGQRLPKGPDGVAGGARLANDAAVHFTGYVEDADLPALYRGADLAAYPSFYEGFGMPVLEGMAAGVPVLTSNVSSLPEVAGGAAMLVDPYDVADIARGIHRALTDDAWRAFAVDAGRTRALQLSWDENARKTERVYQDLWEAAAHARPR